MKNTAAEFKAYEFLSKDYRTFGASELPGGTVWAFFKLDKPDMRVSNTGRFHTDEELAAILRDYHGPIQGGGCA